VDLGQELFFFHFSFMNIFIKKMLVKNDILMTRNVLVHAL